MQHPAYPMRTSFRHRVIHGIAGYRRRQHPQRHLIESNNHTISHTSNMPPAPAKQSAPRDGATKPAARQYGQLTLSGIASGPDSTTPSPEPLDPSHSLNGYTMVTLAEPPLGRTGTGWCWVGWGGGPARMLIPFQARVPAEHLQLIVIFF